VSTTAPTGPTTGVRPPAPARADGSTSSATPTSPTTTPTSCMTRGRFPWYASHSTSQSGTVATSTEAIPELTR